jgi:hypothetical protein
VTNHHNFGAGISRQMVFNVLQTAGGLLGPIGHVIHRLDGLIGLSAGATTQAQTQGYQYGLNHVFHSLFLLQVNPSAAYLMTSHYIACQCYVFLDKRT